MNRSMPGLPVHHQLPEFTQIHVRRVSDAIQPSHLILCRLRLLLLPPILPSLKVFSSESTLRMRWPEYWSFSFSIIPSKEIPGLISFRMDRLDLLAVQGTLKSLLQHHSWKASILRLSAFFTVHLSHGCIKKVEHQRSNQSILKEISAEYSLEGLMLKLKLQYFAHLLGKANSLEKMLGKFEDKRKRGKQKQCQT